MYVSRAFMREQRAWTNGKIDMALLHTKLLLPEALKIVNATQYRDFWKITLDDTGNILPEPVNPQERLEQVIMPIYVRAEGEVSLVGFSSAQGPRRPA